MWTAVKLWPNSTVFIVGGGASLNKTGLVWGKETRDEIRESVNQSLACIHDKRVIGVNNAFELGDWVDVLFFGDQRWIEWNRAKAAAFSGLTVTNVPKLNAGSWVKKLLRTEQFGIDTKPTHCSWNKNSGCAAINLAVHLGAKTIVLIGFDMQVGANQQHDWHRIHRVENHPTRDLPYEQRFLPPIPEIKRDLDKLGIRVINTSMQSQIKEFEKMELEEVMKLC